MDKNYQSILRKKLLKIFKLEKDLFNLNNHLQYHPKDYQAVIKKYELNSYMNELKREIQLLDYQAKVQFYRQEAL